jgi:ElaA protein
MRCDAAQTYPGRRAEVVPSAGRSIASVDPDRLRVAAFGELDAYTLYALLRLRAEVFVVEQECAYLDLDGLDPVPGTRHLWLERAGEPVAYLRILAAAPADGECWIGRVVVAKQARGEGLAARLLEAALDLVGERRCQLNAQSYLVGFYRRYGFVPTGPEFLDDGIPHTPMARAASTSG